MGDLAGPLASGFNAAARAVHTVDPTRLAMGRWDDTEQNHVGEGDIYASYSADRIALAGKVRTPFVFRGQAWVCTSNYGLMAETCSTAYRLVPLDYFKGSAVSFAEKTADCAAARVDPNGFYHGIIVQHRSGHFVLCGPPARFTAGPNHEQPGLFDQRYPAGP